METTIYLSLVRARAWKPLTGSSFRVQPACFFFEAVHVHQGSLRRAVAGRRFEGFLKLGVPFWGPPKRDSSCFGFILGSPFFGKLPFEGWVRCAFSWLALESSAHRGWKFCVGAVAHKCQDITRGDMEDTLIITVLFQLAHPVIKLSAS